MEAFSNEAAVGIASALVSSFAPAHCSSKEVVRFVHSAILSLPLSKEQCRDALLTLRNRAEPPLVLGII